MSDQQVLVAQVRRQQSVATGDLSKHLVVSLGVLFAVLLVPAALLTTNLSFGLPIAETMPLLFIGVGVLFVLAKGQLSWQLSSLIPVVILAFGLFGIFGQSPMDGLRLATAAIVFFMALQLGVEGNILGRGCAITLYILFSLRVVSVFIPEQMAAFYAMLGLRAAHLYGGGVAILFAEPSYLASAAFAMWGIAKCSEQQTRYQFKLVDVCAISVLMLSGSVSALAYAVCGVVILLRHRPVILACGFALGVSTFGLLLALEGNRLSVFANAAVAMFSYGTLEDAVSAFVAVDPSASFRLAMAVLAITSAFRAPMGHFEFEMSRDLNVTAASDRLGLYRGNELLDSLVGNLQPNTVPFQLMYYGGWPLVAVFFAGVVVAIARLYSSRKSDDAYPLVIAALLSGCVFQSVLTSPFFYLSIAFSLSRRRVAGD